MEISKIGDKKAQRTHKSDVTEGSMYAWNKLCVGSI